MKIHVSFVSAAMLAALAVAACRKEEPQNPSGFAATTDPSAGTPPPATTTAPPTTTTTPPPPPPPTTTATTASPTKCEPAAATMLSAVLTPLQQAQAPGSKAVGSVCGIGQPGQVLEVPVTLQPGKCYTGLGGGLPPLTELQLQLVAQAPVAGAPPVVLATSTPGGGVSPVLGGKGKCFKNPLPIAGPAIFLLKFSGGQGPALATIYEK